MAASTSSSILNHGDVAISPSAASSIAASSTLYSTSSSSTLHNTSVSSTSLSGTDHLRDVFHKRIRSLVYLKRSLQGQRTWFSTVQLNTTELASAFDNDRMHKRTLRYSLLGLSLSAILEIANPSDMARAIVSLINELDSYTDDNIVALTSSTGAANFGTQRPRMRSFFKSGKQTLKRSTAAQAISEFGTLDSNLGPASTFAANEQNSYMMAPNIPFQLDFFQTFFTLCDMLTEIYYKMLSFLPRDVTHATDAASNFGTLPRAASPPTSASGHTSQEHDRTGSISQAFSAATDTYTDANDKSALQSSAPLISGMTQELLLKADAKIKKTIHAQVKDIDVIARQMIKDELSSLDPLMKDLGIDSIGSSSSAFLPSNPVASTAASTKSSTPIGGLPSSSTTSLPFGFTSQPTSTASHSTASTTTANTSTSSKLSGFVSSSGLPSHFRRPKDTSTRASQDSTHHGHHQFNLASLGSGGSNKSPIDENAQVGTGGIGSLIRSRSGRLRRVMSGEARPSSSHGQASATSATPTSESTLPSYPTASGGSPTKEG
ncbi:uncharacterized protein UTRI_03225_B [Ustilago trichophora]|uniref:Uncharacterized protein n=1 Tax=Ustilago trichophora TaxID=86804 RepID=A0A5C3E483_9BASI|nr:uncharacterized protein UTRI_03225_B [Ustilago trichophora]